YWSQLTRWDLRTGKRTDGERRGGKRVVEALQGPRTLYSLEGGALLRKDIVTNGVKTVGEVEVPKQGILHPLADGKHVAIADYENGTVELLDAATGKRLHRWKVPRAIAFASSADGKYLAGRSGVLVWLWEIKTGRKTTPFAPYRTGGGRG